MYSVNNHIAEISVEDYLTQYRDADKFIGFCKQCNRYNNCWACPPFNFNEEEYLSKYTKVYIIGTKIIFFDKAKAMCKNTEDSKMIGAKAIEEVRKNLDEQLLNIETENSYSKAFFAGTCHFCPKEDCTRRLAMPCRYPDKIRPSLESLGFDIGKTTEELLNIKLQWSNDGSLPLYLTLVSGLFTNAPIQNIEKYFEFK